VVTCTGDECNTSACNQTTGQCDKTPKDASPACTDTDNNACTTAGCETVDGVGQCVQTHNVVTCTGDECNTSACNQTTGQCVNTPISPPPAQCVQVGCRMTGGKNNFVYPDSQDGDLIDGQYGSNSSNGPFYTVGGQIGAPGNEYCLAAGLQLKGQCKTGNKCVGGPNDGQDCNPDGSCPSYDKTNAPWGEWEHVHHSGQDDDGSFITPGSFAFHAGSHSAPDAAYIQQITCSDEGWCVQARPAPDKQIQWEGLGVFQNLNGPKNTPQALPVFKNNCPVVPYNSNSQNSSGKNKLTPTLHYYTAHVGDFGEPAGDFQKPVSPGCSDPGGFGGEGGPWHFDPGGVANGTNQCDELVNNHNLSVTTPNEKFTELHNLCTAQNCSVYDPTVPEDDPASNPDLTGCPDWYDIEIHCTDDPASPVIYHVGHFLDEGNFQIHPEVGDSCNPGDVTPT
jgi:hypothetical protein